MSLPDEVASPTEVVGQQSPGLPVTDTRLAAAFTVDVEDWYQSSVDFDAAVSERVVGNVDRVVALLDECGVKGTFFVQGLVAEAFPGMVQRLVSEGHEVQSHGYSHRPLFEMDRTTLQKELERGRKSVEDAAGRPVTAFRAGDFSILRSNLWALEVLAEQGFRVDSSIFPVRMRRYGIEDWESGPQRMRFPNGAEILEVPVSSWGDGNLRIPVGGGGYFRLLPLAILRRGLRSVARRQPVVVYCHPYEFNSRELADYRDLVPWRLRLHQGVGRNALMRRVRELFAALPFGRLDRVLEGWGLA